ncbi:MAG: helix-turn-helix domain-containing protein [Rhodospirillales bacterium]|nr:helix-turn-helix domain-containing protein [Rhodospirillales bacterium]
MASTKGRDGLSPDREKVLELHKAGKGPSAIAKGLKIGRSSVYRLINAGDAA